MVIPGQLMFLFTIEFIKQRSIDHNGGVCVLISRRCHHTGEFIQRGWYRLDLHGSVMMIELSRVRDELTANAELYTGCRKNGTPSLFKITQEGATFLRHPVCVDRVEFCGIYVGF